MTIELPIKVGAGFAAAVQKLHPGADCVDGFRVEYAPGGDFVLVQWNLDTPIPTVGEVSAAVAELEAELPGKARRTAYAKESDALVIRAMRLQLAGDPGADAAKDEALAKVAEIKARHPDLEAK